jgi:uncharacterized membrane protein YcjF (UPF0283 family)
MVTAGSSRWLGYLAFAVDALAAAQRVECGCGRRVRREQTGILLAAEVEKLRQRHDEIDREVVVAQGEAELDEAAAAHTENAHAAIALFGHKHTHAESSQDSCLFRVAPRRFAVLTFP